ncbi:hypothetical protein [Snodgrassella communis]|uniref:hypothetical protein n=1 Tax=Snodgrassella communis TaxID=2946699 RepID=UPI001EF5B8B2|nr:hypothetical protein [Snodgrassella communis]
MGIFLKKDSKIAITLKQVNPDINKAKLEKWQYGKIAYIFYIGSYTSENSIIQKLLDSILFNELKIIKNIN